LEWNFLFKKSYWRSRFSSKRAATEPRSPDTPLEHANANASPIIRVNNLVKKFGPDKVAVNNVSFDLFSDQITSLLGPNGSGKTTVFNCLIGIYEQTSGSITIESDDGNGYDTRQQIDRLRQFIGYCPQHDILFDLLTIEEQLEFYATARGFGRYKKQIAEEMLDIVNLRSSRHLFCKSLSGGMKRRLSLACAFVGDTRIILLDEVSFVARDESVMRPLCSIL
jgi:ABC-type multidrug transport system ATPase subunit